MKYIVHFRYKPDADRQEIGKLIPAEQARVAELHKDGTLEAVYVSKDVQQGWLVFATDDENTVEQALQSLPLHPFWTTDSIAVNTPALS